MSNETTPVGQYTFRESALVQGMYQIVDGQGNCVGVLRDLSDAAMLCRHLNIALGQASREQWIPTAEDVKRWFQLLVGIGEEAMQDDIRKTLAKSKQNL